MPVRTPRPPGRKYELKRRAERQDQTRQRIVDAAIALHTTIGPARTTVSAIAERAGVQRHTVYSHFPDERSLGLACSGCHVERHPLPDAAAWQEITDPERRLRRGFEEVYAYYARTGEGLAPILRDAESDALTRELLDLRFRPAFERMRDVLAEPFHARGARRTRLIAALDLFLHLHTWHLLARTTTMAQAVEAAVRAVSAQAAQSGQSAEAEDQKRQSTPANRFHE
jgi:AcrR family transcriptional regulator